jgi:hypothetical protein
MLPDYGIDHVRMENKLTESKYSDVFVKLSINAQMCCEGHYNKQARAYQNGYAYHLGVKQPRFHDGERGLAGQDRGVAGLTRHPG